MIFSVFITILLILLAILLFLVLMVLFIPFVYASHGSYYDSEGGLEARVDWLYGLVRFRYSLTNHRTQALEFKLFGFIGKELSPEERRDKKAVKEKANSERIEKSRKEKKGGYSLKMLPEILKSARRVLRRYKPGALAIDATIGFEDACHTGLMCAGLSSLSPLLESYRDIKVRPDFTDEIIEGCYTLQGRITVSYILYEALRLYFSKPFRDKRRHRKSNRAVNAEKGVRINNNHVEVM